ncbi:Zinc finger and BTB domain-containing protein 16-A [Eumeta japonica]|uniref:Zinc finger and BTB domain-containing protein 16-A n=1 Tax=Eumeta variegata TaxID=151549 RepID=A0A4C1TTL5_EUMVA|nr:Zinc finger and BTB domain-containing protein 16-A [Eumeta japonica]
MLIEVKQELEEGDEAASKQVIEESEETEDFNNDYVENLYFKAESPKIFRDKQAFKQQYKANGERPIKPKSEKNFNENSCESALEDDDKIKRKRSKMSKESSCTHELTKQLKCDICQKLFKHKSSLTRHLLNHSTGNKNLICSKCGKGFVAEQSLNLHIRLVHNADSVCEQCGKTIHGFEAYKKHLMEHPGIETAKFTCDICGRKLTTYHTLMRHYDAYHNDGSTIYVCDVCGKVAASKDAMEAQETSTCRRRT